MSTGLHKDLEIGEIHRVHCLEYADASTREGASGFVTTDIGRVCRQLDDESYWVLEDNSPVTWALLTSDPSNLTADSHKTLRQLIHFIDNGPAEGFASGAYREMTGTVFPTAITWYDKVGVGKKKIVEKLVTWTGAFPTTIAWKIYDSSETLLATVSDAISYSGPFETSRTRTIS